MAGVVDVSEAGPVVRVGVVGLAETGDEAGALGSETDEVEVVHLLQVLHDGAETLAEGVHASGECRVISGDESGGAGKGEAAAGEEVAGGGLVLDEQDGGAGMSAEVGRV